MNMYKLTSGIEQKRHGIPLCLAGNKSWGILPSPPFSSTYLLPVSFSSSPTRFSFRIVPSHSSCTHSRLASLLWSPTLARVLPSRSSCFHSRLPSPSSCFHARHVSTLAHRLKPWTLIGNPSSCTTNTAYAAKQYEQVACLCKHIFKQCVKTR